MKLTIEIASVSDRENLVAEIWNDNEMFAEISQEDSNKLTIEIYPRQNSSKWVIEYKAFTDTLIAAKKQLIGGIKEV